MPRQPEPVTCDLTPAQLATLDAYLDAGSIKLAAYRLGVHEQTVKKSLARSRRRTGVETNAQLVLMVSGRATKGVLRS